MKLFGLLTLCGAACFGQSAVPAPIIAAHSVTGDATIDITDVDIKTAYGTTETKAVLSICVSRVYDTVQVSVTAPSIQLDYQLASILKPVSMGNCASVVAPGAHKDLQMIQVYLSNTKVIMPAKPATDGATAQSLR